MLQQSLIPSVSAGQTVCIWVRLVLFLQIFNDFPQVTVSRECNFLFYFPTQDTTCLLLMTEGRVEFDVLYSLRYSDSEADPRCGTPTKFL